MYKSDDFRPYLYKTTDYGKTWTQDRQRHSRRTHFTRVIREDPNRRDLLFAGTESGMYVSFNGGEHWQSFQLNLPVVPITDLAFHKRENELVVATQGRAFWILDDLPLIYQLADNTLKEDMKLFQPKDTYRLCVAGSAWGRVARKGENPPPGRWSTTRFVKNPRAR